MRIILFAAALMAASPVFAAPTPKQLEIETWRAFTAGRSAEFRSLLSSDFIGVYADGTHDLAKELQVTKDVHILDYRLNDLVSRPIDRDNVLVTYSADVSHLVDGKPASTRLQVATLWHRTGGKWLTLYHTEIKAK